MKKTLYKILYVQVLAAIVIGVLLGFFFPDIGASMKPLGDGFIKLIKMLIAPVIFCTVVIGIAGMEDMKKVGKVGGLALLYFEAVTTLALFVGLFLVNILQPGAGMHVDPATLDMNSVSMYATAEKPQSTLDFLFHIIPSSVVGAFAQGDILQVLFFSIIFGFALQFLGGSRHPVYELIKKGSDILFLMINWIMKVAPIGAFGAIAFTIGKYGIHSLLPLGKLMLVFYATCLFFVFGHPRCDLSLQRFFNSSLPGLYQRGTSHRSRNLVFRSCPSSNDYQNAKSRHQPFRHRSCNSDRIFVQSRRNSDLPYDGGGVYCTGL